MVQENNDWAWINQMIYRFIEVTSCGSMLMANTPPGIERFFTPGEHFISFETPQEAAQLIEYYLSHEEQRSKIAANGKRRADTLIKARIFWNSIDIALGPLSIT